MSSTNRGTKRRKRDYYPTPTWTTEAIIPIIREWNPATILEPCCGSDAIVEVLRRHIPSTRITHFDLEPQHECAKVDFLTEPPRPEFDVICTNPPYSSAVPFIERAKLWRLTPQSAIVMLVGLNILESAKRAPWWRLNPPTGIYVLPNRPSFTGDGKTESTGYAWFVWDARPIRIEWLATKKEIMPSLTRKPLHS